MQGVAEKGQPMPDADGREEGRRVAFGSGSGGGRAAGPAHVALPFEVDAERLKGTELAHLVGAIEQSAEELEATIARSDRLEAELLEFQARMLRDPELADLARDRIARGEPAALAWAAAMEDYIASFEVGQNSEPPGIMDLVDIRNRVLAKVSNAPRPGFPAGSVFVGDDIEPSVFLDHDWSAGGAVALRRGSGASHVAMLARAKGVPMVTALGSFDVEDGTPLLVDGESGRVVIRPDDQEIAAARHAAPAAAESAQIPRGVRFLAAVNTLEDLDHTNPASCSGIGLARTEFLLGNPAVFLQEEAQLSVYSELAKRSPGPAAIRLLDLGGDKPVRGLTPDEPNPFLGVRGVRFLLERRDLLAVQARALLRTAATHELSVIVPMVTTPVEFEAVAAAFAQEAENLRRGGFPYRRPALGMMVETPAAALMLEAFAADFFAIGASDLLQYLSAVSRDHAGLAETRRGAVPALLRLIGNCVNQARRLGKPIGVCGDIAADPAFAAQLFDAGVRSFTAPPAQLGEIARVLSASGRHD